MSDAIMYSKTAHGIAKSLERVFPRGNPLVSVSDHVDYSEVNSPGGLLRALADAIDPPKKPAKKKAKKAA